MAEIKCPNCGAINPNKVALNRYHCPYCDHEYAVNLDKTDIVDAVKDGAKSASKGLLKLIFMYFSFVFPFVGIACYYSKEFFDHKNKRYLYASIAGTFFWIFIILVICLI